MTVLELSGRPTDWVDASPFRTQVTALMSQTGLPWRAVAVAAGVPSRTVQRLLEGRDGRPVRRIRARDAQRLLGLSARRIARMEVGPVDARRARRATRYLLTSGIDVPIVQAWLDVTEAELAALLDPAAGHCRAIVAVRAEAAAEAHGWPRGEEEPLRPMLPRVDNLGAAA